MFNGRCLRFHHQESEKATYRMRKIFVSHISDTSKWVKNLNNLFFQRRWSNDQEAPIKDVRKMQATVKYNFTLTRIK